MALDYNAGFSGLTAAVIESQLDDVEEPEPNPNPEPSDLSCEVDIGANLSQNHATVTFDLTNTSNNDINHWQLRVLMPDGGTLQQNGWGAIFSQSGSEISGSNYSWNALISKGSSISNIGFNITHDSQYNNLDSLKENMLIYLNDQMCTIK